MTEQFQIVEYNQTAAALEILRQKYSGPFDVSTTKGMALAKEARADVRGYRVALEKLRVEIKVPALERTRLIDAEAKRITAELLAIEEPIDAVIKAEEKRKEEEKAAKARAEAERVASIMAIVNGIKNAVTEATGKTAVVIRAKIEELNGLVIGAEFMEFGTMGVQAKADTITALEQMAAAADEAEAERQRQIEAETERQHQIEAERQRQAEAAAELARQQQELARQKAEILRQKAEIEAERQRQEAEAERQHQIEAEAERQRQAAAAAEAERQRQEAEAAAAAERVVIAPTAEKVIEALEAWKQKYRISKTAFDALLVILRNA